jgi:hypothetical protein
MDRVWQSEKVLQEIAVGSGHRLQLPRGNWLALQGAE